MTALMRVTRYVTFCFRLDTRLDYTPGWHVFGGAVLPGPAREVMYIPFWPIPKNKASCGSDSLYTGLGYPSHQKDKEESWFWTLYERNKRKRSLTERELRGKLTLY